MKRSQVIFMLGGPGSGKGTQSQRITRTFSYNHLSAGQLLRRQQARVNSEYSQLIKQIIHNGTIVPSHITISLLKRQIEIEREKKNKFLIDGFPRNWENYQSWNDIMGASVITPFIIFLKCSQSCLIKRLEGRGRSDDRIEVIIRRLKTFRQETMPVVQDFQKQGKAFIINGDQNEEAVFEEIKQKIRWSQKQ